MSNELEVSERLAIFELLSRAAYALDERELEMLANSFTEDASFSMRIAGGDLAGPFEGREGIMELMTGAMAQQTDKRRHVVSNEFFTEAGAGRASVVSNLTLISTEDGEIRLLTAGVYRDEVVKTAAGWQLSRRHLDLDRPY